MPTGTLPAEGKALWERVYDKALKGSCNGDKECAARTAWSAVKGAGWAKDKDGNWHKKAIASEFSLTISKASYNKETNRMNFWAVASDMDEDSYNDNMTSLLFNDFISRIKTAELPPEQYRSDFWKGGMPYISLSHYPDLNGKAVPGIVENVYVDGNRLKARGYFYDTPLGRACFNAIKRDLAAEQPNPDGNIRISIAFLDYSHMHKSNGYIYQKGNEDEPVCMECLRELFAKSGGGKEFLLGHLIHLALTRVPVNKRTSVEVKSMAINTRKDDALSIVGEDEEAKSLVEDVDKEALLVGKSELVIKSEEAPEVPEELIEEAVSKKEKEEEDEKEEEAGDEEDKACSDKRKKEMKSEVDLSPVISELQSLRSLVEGLKQPVVVHPLDSFIGVLKAKYDEIVEMSGTADDKLRSLQEPFNVFSQALVENVRSSVVEKVEIVQEKTSLSKDEIVNEVMQKVGAELAEIKSLLKPQQPVQQSQVPAENVNALVRDLVHRRSLTPTSAPVSQSTLQSKPTVIKSIQELVNRTT